MYLLPLLSCFASCFIAGTPIARYLGHRGASIMSLMGLFVSFVSSIFIWIEVCLMGSEVYMDFGGVWFEVGSFHVGWNLCFDLLTAHMLLTVTGVSAAVHAYTIVYMRSDPHLNLFLSYLSLFTFFMLVLVTADNLVLMFVGWEGIGVCSYLLIGYWSHRLSAVKSAQKAILVNRLSDGMLMWGVIWIWHHTGTLEYDLIVLSAQANSFLGLAIMVGAMGKSAQILFHVWLADAMEGPTPVSALIHAATLVTAGVYLMVRLGPFWDDLVILVGCLTAFMAGVFGIFQSDLKRVIAFSTCSQLGYMMVSVGLGEHGTEASMGHLMTHASFKAALFLAAGLVIHSSFGNQHIARYGGLSTSHVSVFCYLTLLIGSLSLVGWPELSGFYSKETILNLAYVSFHPVSDYAHNLLLVTALLTSCYTSKLFFQCFIMDFSGSLFANPSNQHKNTHAQTQNNFVITSDWLFPAVAMTILLCDIMLKVWVGANLLSGILFFIPWGVKTLPFGLVIAGILTAAANTATQLHGVRSLSAQPETNLEPLSPISMAELKLIRFCGTRWGFDQLYARSMVNLVLDWGRISWAAGDRGLFSVGELRAHL